MTILRRVSGLTPQPITTEVAPSFGRDHVDIGDGGRRAAPNPLTKTPRPPRWQPGTCYHHGHVVHDGKRYGVLVLNDSDASLLRCEHYNSAGR